MTGAGRVPASTGTNLDGMRDHNAAVVLDAVRRNPGITRSEIARGVGLTRQAVAKIITRLAGDGLVRSDGAVAAGVGAPREQFHVVPGARCAVGVAVDRTGWRLVLVDLLGEPLARAAGSYPTVPEPPLLVADLALATRRMVQESGVDPARVVGLGAGVVGPLDAARGTVTDATNFGDWHDVPLAGLLAAATGLTCRIDTDTNAAALGELWRLPGETDALVVYAGSGVGAGLVLDGTIHHGATGNAGEFGHMLLAPGGPACVCGRRGCVEALTSQAAIVAAVSGVGTGAPVGWRPETAGEFEEITARAAAGEPACIGAIRSAGHLLGVAVANVIQLMDLPTVVLTGPTFAEAGALYADAAIAAITADAEIGRRTPPRVHVSTRGGEAVDLGAAVLGFGQLRP